MALPRVRDPSFPGGYDVCDTFHSPVVVLGDQAVDKTSFLELATRGILVTADSIHDTTLGGITYGLEPISFPLRPVRLRLWDIAQAPPYLIPLSLSEVLGDASGIVLMYDVHDKASFEHLDQHLALARSHMHAVQRFRPVEVVVLANKADEEEGEAGQWQVSRDEGEHWAQHHGLPLWFISCRTGHHVQEALRDLATRLYQHIKDDAQ